MITGPVLEMLERNSKYAQTYEPAPTLLQLSEAARAGGKGVLVLSCADPRLHPEQILGIDPTLQAVMIRNAGGRAMDGVRSLAVLQTISGAKTIVVMHHTDCGMTHFHDATLKKAMLEISPNEKGLIESTKFGEILSSIEESVGEDVAYLKASPFIKKDTQIIGLKYDIETGILSEVE